jgi:hypothetical protein
MTTRYVTRLAKAVLYRQRLLAGLPGLEAELGRYLREQGLEQLRVDGYLLGLTHLERRSQCSVNAQYPTTERLEYQQTMEELEREYAQLRARAQALAEDARDWLAWEPASDDIKWYAVRVLKALEDVL